MADATATNLDARREAALARIAELELPSFRGAAGWEFTPIDKLDLDAYPVAPTDDQKKIKNTSKRGCPAPPFRG